MLKYVTVGAGIEALVLCMICFLRVHKNVDLSALASELAETTMAAISCEAE